MYVYIHGLLRLIRSSSLCPLVFSSLFISVHLCSSLLLSSPLRYCGTSDASTLTMENVPWHKDVVAFAQAIAQRLKEKAATVGYVVESI